MHVLKGQTLFAAGVGSFLLYSVHEGIRGIPLDPSDKSDALVPVSGTSLAVGIDFHAGKTTHFVSKDKQSLLMKVFFFFLMLVKQQPQSPLTVACNTQ